MKRKIHQMKNPGSGPPVEYDDDTPLTDVQAEKLLKRLSKHYNEPVMPMKHYCAAIDSWMRAIEQGCREELKKNKEAGQPDALLFSQGCDYYDRLSKIRRDMNKSGLLYRLLFRGEKIRIVKCPTHNGKMDTPVWCGLSKETCVCDGTGWLPNEEEIPKTSG